MNLNFNLTSFVVLLLVINAQAQQSSDSRLEDYTSLTKENIFAYEEFNVFNKENTFQEKDLTDFVPILDSVYSYSSSFNDNLLMLRSRRRTLGIDEYGNILSAIDENLLEDESWNNSISKLYTFHSATQANERIEFPWNSNTQEWADTSLCIKYSAEGLRLLLMVKYWDSFSNTFDGGSRIRSETFTNEGEIYESYFEDWYSNSDTWYPIYKNTFIYENENVSEFNVEEWNSTLEIWENSYRIFYTYDDNDARLERKYQKFESDEWVNFNLRTYTNNENGSTMVVLYESWNNSSLQWETASMTTFTYDDTENEILKYSEIWDSTLLQWEPKSRDVTTYNDSNGSNVEVYQIWTEEDWQNDSKTTNIYDENQSHIEYDRKNWDVDSNEWRNRTKFLYFYSLQDVTDLSEINPNLIAIYPNPFVDKLYISNDDFSIDHLSIKLFSTKGELLKENAFSANELDVSQLSAGVYYLQVIINNEKFVKKIIKL